MTVYLKHNAPSASLKSVVKKSGSRILKEQ